MAVPVVDAAGDLVGIVFISDLAWHAAHEPDAPIGTFARPSPETLLSTETLERAADLMADASIPLLPIVAAGSARLVAIVTRRDVLNAYRSLART